ncbi:heptaprenyl diphosphate synthase component 1 [Alkalihalobacillus sp. FSL W8-0930]
MVNPSHLAKEVTAIIEKFNQLTYHPYIEKYIPSVGIDDEKCRLFYASLSKKTSKEDAFVITLCAMLVQAALDVHEEVTLHPVHSDDARKNRQLHVLIGDYYSSLYYYLLAGADHVPLTRLFSHTLQEINEQKMNVYEVHHADYVEMADHVRFIESGLYGKLLEQFELSEDKEIFEKLFFYKRFMDEWNKWTGDQDSSLIRTFLKHTDVSRQQDALLQKQDELRSSIQELYVSHSDFTDHIDQFLSEAIPSAPIEEMERKVR